MTFDYDLPKLAALRAEHPGAAVWMEVAPRMYWDGKDTIPLGGMSAAVKVDQLIGRVVVVESSGQVLSYPHKPARKIALRVA